MAQGGGGMTRARKAEVFRPLSPAMEDYLKTIYTLQEEHATVTTQLLADFQGVAPASVTHMLKRLAEHKLVHYTPYHGVALTEAGRKVAIEMVRHHRLLELYLTQALGFGWDEVHAEAERLEHFISEKLEERIDAALGYPKMDPHGSPIPSLDGTVVDRGGGPLRDQPPGERSVVLQVADEEGSALRRFAEIGLWPGVTVEVLEHGPAASRVRVANRVWDLEDELCALIRVTPSTGHYLSADQMHSGQTGHIHRLRAGGERLRRLRGLGLEQGREVTARDELTYRVDGRDLELSREEARCILVELPG
ncbi:MAG: metal-dependent transcriptional regulator [Candidatus Eremiobacterota bacterium]